MDVELLTGRTHQIRVHAAHAGHPLAGDRKYGEKDFNQQMKKLGLKRQFLHAWSITLRHPQTDKKVTYAAPLDEDLENVLQQLKPVN
jgi:23S rRNA pseudouridine955/2504/2580 synthase